MTMVVTIYCLNPDSGRNKNIKSLKPISRCRKNHERLVEYKWNGKNIKTENIFH